MSLSLDANDERPESPELEANILSRITFWWFNDFLINGYRTKLKLNNLWKTLVRDRTDKLVPIFKEKWVKTAKSTKTQKQTNNIVKVLFRIFWFKLLTASLLKLIQDSLQFLTPMILKSLLAFMKNDKSGQTFWDGFYYVVLILIVPIIQSVVLGNYFYFIQVIALQVRSMIVGAVYRKALVLSNASRVSSTSGEIVNLMAVDSQRFQELLMYINLFWSAPFQIIVSVYFLYRELGWPAFAGVGCMALILPCNAFLAKLIKFSQQKLMRIKDERIKQINEVLNGIKVIKLYAWEQSFIKNLLDHRWSEVDHLKRILRLDAIQTFIWPSSPFIVALVTFAVYINTGENNILDAEKAFVSMALFNILRFPLTMLPSLVTSLILTLVSARRLDNFLNCSEIVPYVTREKEAEAICIEGGTLNWSEEEHAQSKTATLKDIDLHIKPKNFVAIVGQVASGKSSLLSAILGEMNRVAGRFNICKNLSIAYVPQQAWIQNMTVRDNITFGAPFSDIRYRQILSACSLNSDLETLPGGDQAEIGEKGINLSGGQKQRVSLARACYSDSDIILLDDPLSALDSHVAKHVFDKVLSSRTGLLRNKTRVLATNSLFVLPYTDHIIVLDKGETIESGSYRELMQRENGVLAEFMRNYYRTREGRKQVISESDEIEQKSLEEIVAAEEKVMKSVAIKPDIVRLTEVEKLETGRVNYCVYVRYFRAISIGWLSVLVVSLISSASLNVGTNLWLSAWTSDAENVEMVMDVDQRSYRLVIYATLGTLQCLSVLFGSLGLSQGSIRASKKLHTKLLDRVMHSPMSFFDTTPIGRIVNRFAKDIDVVDSTIPGCFRGWLTCLLQVGSTIFIICYSFPAFLVIIIPLGVLYYMIQKVFIVTARQLKRLESITRSPIYSHFGETLSGLSTIRAYDCVDRFVSMSDDLVDRNQSCGYPNMVAHRWLSIRLELFGNILTASAALFSVYFKGAIGANVAGLTVSFSMNITQTLSWLVRLTSDLETNIVSVERILEYTQNLQEDLWVKERRPPTEWPDKGSIKMDGYSTRYRDDTGLVLKDLSIDIKPSEKVGIVGRTGSGKSSLSLSLFRILDAASGKITIDGIDVTELGLHDLRSRLTIIPQDPVIFSGTLRFNLDPLKLYSDFEIWHALDLAHLKSYVVSLEGDLDFKVGEYGDNFSLGQKQLICLARAILRKSKILILDEATASVDLETDLIVQRTIRKVFGDCTIITIAHRLHTILDSDRILVLDNGRVKELDSPTKLAANHESAFASLLHDSGIDMALVKKVLPEQSSG